MLSSRFWINLWSRIEWRKLLLQKFIGFYPSNCHEINVKDSSSFSVRCKNSSNCLLSELRNEQFELKMYVDWIDFSQSDPIQV